MKGLLCIILMFFNLQARAFDHSHGAFTNILKKRVNTLGAQTLVDYKGLKNNPEQLDNYINSLAAISESEYKDFSADQRLAFLINAYNAYTLKLMRDNWPVKSIKDLGGFFSSPWKKEIFPLLGKKRSLDWIEHDTIRREFDEPRIHFAVNCASLGCPPLRAEAFEASKLEIQLEEQARIFLNDQHENRLEGSTTKLSKIFDWYGKDFATNEKELVGVLNQWRDQKFPENSKIEFLDYGWDANVVGAKE